MIVLNDDVDDDFDDDDFDDDDDYDNDKHFTTIYLINEFVYFLCKRMIK